MWKKILKSIRQQPTKPSSCCKIDIKEVSQQPKEK
ncbi:hypothetical protein A33I_15320 [Alkalihalophilus marmarensis DSM 21297]|uniref:Uncharacterized protein n=1 Tax=Alkalihalophilus marmarensis DSM 21297 TaxID=1188261 RepID=U6SM07_9BACI|nr:hypothetical protein A33I_15320 [Alkalihalophilus marmarensis DSM 21297]